MSSARFKIRNLTTAGAWSAFDDAGFDCAPSDVLEVQLEDTPALDINTTVFTWTSKSDGRTDPVFDPVSGTAATPTSAVEITMPNERGTWALTCRTNGGEAVLDSNGRADLTVNTKVRFVAVRTANLDLRHPLDGERSEYQPGAGYAVSLQELMDAVDPLGILSAVIADAAILLDTATPEASLPNAVLGRALSATLELVRSAGVVLGVRRVDEPVDSALTVMQMIADGVGAGVANYGASLLARVKGATALQDAGALDISLTNVGAGTEASALAVRLRTAGGALAAALKLTPGVTSFYDSGVLAALFTHPDATAPSFVMQKRSGTGAAAPQTFTVRARQGRDASGGTNSTGDHFALRSGLVGTGGADGSAGSLILGTGDTDRITIDDSASTIAMTADVVSMTGIRSALVGELTYDASVSLGFFSEHVEITITGDITFTDGPGLSGTLFWVHAYRDAVVAPVITWPVAFLFATSQGVISATNSTWTHWHFYVDMNGAVHCLQRTTNE